MLKNELWQSGLTSLKRGGGSTIQGDWILYQISGSELVGLHYTRDALYTRSYGTLGACLGTGLRYPYSSFSGCWSRSFRILIPLGEVSCAAARRCLLYLGYVFCRWLQWTGGAGLLRGVVWGPGPAPWGEDAGAHPAEVYHRLPGPRLQLRRRSGT